MIIYLFDNVVKNKIMKINLTEYCDYRDEFKDFLRCALMNGTMVTMSSLI